MRSFNTVRAFNTIADSAQDVSYDGSYYYASDNDNIYKYALDGTFITSRDTTSDGTNFHNGGLCIVGDTLYLTASAYPATPYNLYVKEYNASDLSYKGVEHFIDANYISESIQFKDNRFWLIGDNQETNIMSLSDSFGDRRNYTIPAPPTPMSGSHGWNGMTWVDDDLYLNVHEGSLPDKVQKYHFDGYGLTWKEEFERPAPAEYTTQGMFWKEDEKLMMFALRGYSIVSDGIVFAQIADSNEIDRDKLQYYSGDPIDKIVDSGTFSISHAGARAVTVSNVINQPSVREVTSTTPNNYGKACFIRAVYSIDGGTNWNSVDTVLQMNPQFALYIDGVFSQNGLFPGIKMQVAIGCTDTDVIAVAMGEDFSTSTFRIDVNSGTGNSTYSGWSATAHTVMIKYWLYEVS